MKQAAKGIKPCEPEQTGCGEMTLGLFCSDSQCFVCLFFFFFFFECVWTSRKARARDMRLPDSEGSEHTTLRLVSACAVRLASDVCTLNRSARALLPCERRKHPCPACIKCALKVPAALLSAYSSVLQHCLHTVARSDYSDSRWC